MKTVAFLWWEDEVEFDRETPFGKEWKNKDYAEYTEMLEDRGLNVVCSEYTEYDSGEMKKAFHWNGDEWEKVEDVEIDGVYDLFRHDKEKYEIKKAMENEVGILNDPEVAELCQDKWKTYQEFSQYQAETRKASKANVKEVIQKYGKAVIKPRYGSSGEGIYSVDSIEDFEKGEDLLIQQFIEAEAPEWMPTEGQHDMRIFVINGDIMGSHIRTPGQDTFLSNNAQGGDQFYMDSEDIPEQVCDIVDEVEEKLKDYRPSIYTVDFMFDSEERPWIVELNSQPGIFYHKSVKDKSYELPMMEKVCDAIAQKFG